MPRAAELVKPIVDVDTWTPTVLLRGELLRALKENGLSEITRGRFVARVSAHGEKFTWDVIDLVTGRQIAFGVAFLAMTVCTSAALALVTAEAELTGERQLRDAHRK